MEHSEEKKELGIERLVFFSDAIVAIAITLLALELKIEVPAGQHLTFEDLIEPWQKYLAFILSFINIAGFWRAHYTIFSYIKKTDERIMFMNLFWLFFIVVIPFTTSLISSHFYDTPSIFLYCTDVFLVSVFQNFIWDYSISEKNNFVERSQLSDETLRRLRIMFNLDMVNGLIAIIVSFFSPAIAFILLFFKIPIFVIFSFYIASQRRKDLAEGRRHGRNA